MDYFRVQRKAVQELFDAMLSKIWDKWLEDTELIAENQHEPQKLMDKVPKKKK